MGFATALSGLKAAATNLQVTGNNIANAQTTGFKESRAEFADVYAASIGGVSKTQPGSGVRVTEVAQQFHQGNIEATQNALDLAISGNGFFVLADPANVNLPDKNNPNNPVDPSIPSAYTRNGAFQLDKDGNVVDDQGRFLLAFAPNGLTKDEGFSAGVFRPLTIDTSQGLPVSTETINMKLNLNGGAVEPVEPAFNPTNPLSYNNTTSVTVYDSQGNAHIATTYYVKTATPNEWDAYLYLGGQGVEPALFGPPVVPPPLPPGTALAPLGTPPAPIQMTFNAQGALETINGSAPGDNVSRTDYGLIDISDINAGVAPMALNIDFFGTTQFSSAFSVNGLSQNGLPAGNLTGIDVDKSGAVFARYSNGGSKVLGQVALARFPSNQSLAKLGDTSWGVTATSGAPIYGAGGDNNFGAIQSSALEGSNVDLADQLVRLIIAQQTYQANSQTITTEKTLIETILRA